MYSGCGHAHGERTGSARFRQPWGGQAARGAVSLGQRARAELPRAHGNNAMPVGGHNQVFRRVRGFAHVP